MCVSFSLYLSVCEFAYMPQHLCGNQRTAFRSWLSSPSTGGFSDGTQVIRLAQCVFLNAVPSYQLQEYFPSKAYGCAGKGSPAHSS